MKESTFGEQIAHARKEKKLTQAQLAQKFGITDKAVSKWERNLSKPDAIILPELVEFLGLPKESLSDAVRLSGRHEKSTTYENQKSRHDVV